MKDFHKRQGEKPWSMMGMQQFILLGLRNTTLILTLSWRTDRIHSTEVEKVQKLNTLFMKKVS